MPEKYRLKAQSAPNRFMPVTKYAMIEKEGCLGCPVCAKRQCVYDVYTNRHFDLAQMKDSIDHLCKNCLRCIQGCKNQIITRMKNPDFETLGDAYWRPEQIASLWEQAATGKIPVSGAGYRGAFSGPGFDSMWTDMSEIVRPTRDGIHGREYINTSVDIGRKVSHLEFDSERQLLTETPPLIEIPVPFIFDLPPFRAMNQPLLEGFLHAAEEVGTLLVVPEQEMDSKLLLSLKHIIPFITSSDLDSERIREIITRSRIVEFEDKTDISERIEFVRKINPEALVSVRLPVNRRASARVEELVRQGAAVVHIVADWQGNEFKEKKPRFLKDVLREIHRNLVDKALRNQVTVIATGGIAMAEHVAKAIICGADLVGLDLVLNVALECRVCKRCTKGLGCPVEMDSVEPSWATLRISNLACSWHSQLIEVLGAMGLREVRRLRGEVGRAMFYDDLEREAFGDIRVFASADQAA